MEGIKKRDEGREEWSEGGWEERNELERRKEINGTE